MRQHAAGGWQELRFAVINRYDPEGRTCTDFLSAPGETPVDGGVFIKQPCERHTPERDLWRRMRKPGQSETNPATGEYKSWSYFESIDSQY
jgi:hypothetical protein